MNDDILWKIDSEIGKDKKVVELRKEIEDLTNSNNFWKKKCSEMGIALKTYEEGRYQEHLEIERLNNIIDKLEKGIQEMFVDDCGEDTWNYNGTTGDEFLTRTEYLNKIKKLRGSDKE